MRFARFTMIALLTLAGSASAQTAATKASADPAFEAAYAKFTAAYKQADPKAVANLYSKDALYLSPGADVGRGHSFVLGEFQRYLGRFQAGAGPNIAFRIVDRQVNGDLAHDVGYIIMNDGKTPLTESDAPSAKFAVLWKRENGEWKILTDTYNDMPRQPDPARVATENEIRKTVQAYFDGVTNHDVARLDAAFHPLAYLSATSRNGGVYHASYEEWKKFTAQPAGSVEGKNNRIANIQLMGNAAVVTTVLDWPTVRYVDYLSLVKQGDEWKIVSKIWNAEPKK